MEDNKKKYNGYSKEELNSLKQLSELLKLSNIKNIIEDKLKKEVKNNIKKSK